MLIRHSQIKVVNHAFGIRLIEFTFRIHSEFINPLFSFALQGASEVRTGRNLPDDVASVAPPLK